MRTYTIVCTKSGTDATIRWCAKATTKANALRNAKRKMKVDTSPALEGWTVSTAIRT